MYSALSSGVAFGFKYLALHLSLFVMLWMVC
jgi:hypothetical protein